MIETGSWLLSSIRRVTHVTAPFDPLHLRGQEIKRAEKVLAVFLVIFLVVGGFWILSRIELVIARPDLSGIHERY